MKCFRSFGIGVLIAACCPTLLVAQRRGAFADTSATARARSATVAPLLPRSKLLIDPSGRSPYRASAWGATVVAGTNGAEAQIQFNLSNSNTDAVGLTLAAPLSDNGTTDISSLNGLSGTPRLSINLSKDVTESKVMSPSLEVSAGAPEFTYRAQVNGAELQRRKFNYNASFNLKIQSANWEKSYFRIGMGAEEVFEARSAESICSSVEGQSTVLRCANQVIGTPASKAARFADVEFRSVTAGGTGIAVRAINDFKSGDARFEVPVWFIPDAQGKLGGGVRLGYSTNDRKFTLNLFIGQFVP